MALDTEFISQGTYQPHLALLQVATRDEIFLIDPLSDQIQEAPDQPIWDVMADPAVRTIVHAYDQEARFCLQRTGRTPGDLFDVQLAAGFNGHHYPIAYDNLVRKELRRPVGPSQSRTNWLQRPLTDAQQRYAAEDVKFLFQLHDRFINRMTDGGEPSRLAWLREETTTRLNLLGEQGSERWRRLPRLSRLSPRSLAVVKELTRWRESVARRRNLALRRVASDSLLVSIAAIQPTSATELSSVRGIGQLQQEDHALILDIVNAALALPKSELPTSKSPHNRAKPSRMVVLFLESVLAAACAQHNIDPELVGGSSQLRALVNWDKRGRRISETPLMLTGWRREVCAEPLLDALAGNISLRINDPLSDNPLTVSGLPRMPESAGPI